MSAHAHRHCRNESHSSLCRRSRRSGASGCESETFRGARGQPPYLLATFRHLRGVFARAGNVRRDRSSLHDRLWKTRPRLVWSPRDRTRLVKLRGLPPPSKSSSAQVEAPAAPPSASPLLVHNDDPRRLFLIDAMSFIFRAYHAMARQRGMSTRKGLPTAAIYVFVNMLRKLRDDFSPQYLAAVFDVAAPTFRDQQYKEYKANRSEMPGDLAQQIPYIRRALEAYRIPILEMPGYEADDVIGTLATKAAAQDRHVYVVSSDKDMLQLVNDQVLVLNPPKDNLICDAAKVEEILGVPPERVVDVMALRGDSIDNIPGAPGIGDKGSVEIIKRFGTVEAALDRAAEVERRTYRESLQNNREAVLISKKLATIDCDVPIDLDVNAMKAGEPDTQALRALFTELEFTSLLKDLLPVVQVSDAEYHEAKSAADVDAVLKALSPGGALAVAVDSEAQPQSKLEDEAEEAEEEMLPLSTTVTAPEPARCNAN